jgi:hypothetical protein
LEKDSLESKKQKDLLLTFHKQQIGEMDRDTKNLSQRRKEEVALIRQQK